MQYFPVSVTLNGNTYTGTATKKPAPFVPGKPQGEDHYMFVFDNWEGKSGILVIKETNGKWEPLSSGTIQDKDLAQAAGEAIKNML